MVVRTALIVAHAPVVLCYVAILCMGSKNPVYVPAWAAGAAGITNYFAFGGRGGSTMVRSEVSRTVAALLI